MLPLCQAEGIAVLPWSPLARGRLARPWSDESVSIRAKTDAFGRTLFAKTESVDRRIIDRVNELATRRGVPPAQVALAWLLHKPAITAPIVGASQSHHLDDAVAALSVKLSAEEMTSLEEPYVPHAVVGFT